MAYTVFTFFFLLYLNPAESHTLKMASLQIRKKRDRKIVKYICIQCSICKDARNYLVTEYWQVLLLVFVLVLFVFTLSVCSVQNTTKQTFELHIQQSNLQYIRVIFLNLTLLWLVPSNQTKINLVHKFCSENWKQTTSTMTRMPCKDSQVLLSYNKSNFSWWWITVVLSESVNSEDKTSQFNTWIQINGPSFQTTWQNRVEYKLTDQANKALVFFCKHKRIYQQ